MCTCMCLCEIFWSFLYLSQSAAGLTGHLEVDNCVWVQVTDVITASLMQKQVSATGFREDIIWKSYWWYTATYYFFFFFCNWICSDNHVQFFETPWTAACQAPCLSLSPRACSNSFALSQWCHPTIVSSVIPFSFCFLSFPASRSFSMSQLFASDGQSIGASASASVLPMSSQGWFPLTEWQL